MSLTDLGSIQYGYNSKVEFMNVKDTYSVYSDLVCEYLLNGHKPQEGDRVGIYRVGWQKLKDHIVYRAIEESKPGKDYGVFYITFDKYELPKNDDNELYQFCYIGKKNELHAASSTFRITQFTETPKERPNSAEIEKLVKENLALRQALKLIVSVESPAFSVEDLISKISEIESLRKKVEYLEKKCENQYADNKYFVTALEMKYNELLSRHTKLEKEFENYKKSNEKSYEKLGMQFEEYKNLRETPEGDLYETDGPKKAKVSSENVQMETSGKIVQEFDVNSLDSFIPLPPFPLSPVEPINL